MKNLPVEVSDQDIDEMFEFADKNKDGKLSYKEFRVRMRIFVAHMSDSDTSGYDQPSPASQHS